MKRVRSWLLLLISLLVVGFFFYLPQLKQLYLPNTGHHPSHAESHAGHHGVHTGNAHSPVERCSLNAGSCLVELSGGRHLRFAVSPRDIPVMMPVQLLAEVHGGEAREIRVLIEGRDMYMGEQRVGLTQVQSGHFTGEVIVPACDMDHKMVWLAKVEVTDAEQTDQVVFEFTAAQ